MSAPSPSAERGPAGREGPEAEERVSLLLVDDRRESLTALEALLEPLGQRIVTAASGKEALRRLLEGDFAVILLDVYMPVMDGFETAALIRERERSRHTPIIFLTAALKAERHIFQGYAAGAVDYLVKPVVPEILRSKVGVFIELAKKTAALRRLNEVLRRQAAELAAANKEMDSFAYTVAHDLRAPLRSMDGFSQLILEKFGGALGVEGRAVLTRVRAACQRMGQLITDLLDLSRVTRVSMARERVDLSALARVIGAELQKSSPGREVRFSVAEGLCADGDPRLLRLALENLLANAWKFTGKHLAATIEFGARERDGATVFFVRDDGAGFDMRYAQQLFKTFQRLHTTSEFAGTGIGLATVQRIIERHGGRVWAEGELERGATFHFTL